MKRLQDITMIVLCAIILSALFLFFAILALFSETARWAIDESMNKVGDVLTEAEQRSLKRHKGQQGGILGG